MQELKLRLKYGNIEFESEGDPTAVAGEREAFMESLPHIAMMAQIQSDNSKNDKTIASTEEKQIPFYEKKSYSNINSFLNEKGFGSDIDRILGFIYYMVVEENEEFVDSKSVKSRMQNAKSSIPTNIPQSFSALTQRGYIQPIQKQGKGVTKYYITDFGKTFIDEYVKKEIKTVRSGKAPKKVTNKIETRYDFLTKEMMNLDQYPDYYKLGSKEKIMLIMYIIKDINQGEFFTVNDLKYIISNIFNDKLTDDTIKGIFKNKSSAKYFDKRPLENNKKVYEYKMIQSGFTYFENEIMKSNSK